MRITKIGLKANAAFLFSEMKGDTEGGVEDGILWVSIMHVNQRQLKKFKKLIAAFGGCPGCLEESNNPHVDYECYFVKE